MSKASEIPNKYTHDWIDKLDGRTGIAKLTNERYAALCTDLGGESQLSYQRRSLVKRALFMELQIEQQESALARGEDVDTGRLTQSVNSLIGLYKTLGLDRQARTVDLAQYVKQKGDSA